MKYLKDQGSCTPRGLFSPSPPQGDCTRVDPLFWLHFKQSLCCLGQDGMCCPLTSLCWQQIAISKQGKEKCVWGSNFVCRRKVFLIFSAADVWGGRNSEGGKPVHQCGPGSASRPRPGRDPATLPFWGRKQSGPSPPSPAGQGQSPLMLIMCKSVDRSVVII